MDFRGTAIAGIWIGSALIVGAFNYFGTFAEASIPMIIVAFILTINVMRQDPGSPVEHEMRSSMDDMVKRVLDLERKVDDIKRLLDE